MYRNNYYHFLVLTLPALRVTEKLPIANIPYFHVLNAHEVAFYFFIFSLALFSVCTPEPVPPARGTQDLKENIYFYFNEASCKLNSKRNPVALEFILFCGNSPYTLIWGRKDFLLFIF